MKKLMSLGGNYFQQTLVKRAKEMGIYVIDVDYLPDNPAHKYADEYHNISIVEKEQVLELARKLKIDGIVSYASDVGAPTAAYVAEKMHIPTNPYDAVEILTHKDKFRSFMIENNYLVPKSRSFYEKENIQEEVLSFYSEMNKNCIIKPIDASGSKGVTKIECAGQIPDAIQEAMFYSHSKRLIVEEFIDRVGYQIDGDGFIYEGKIAYWGVMDQHKDETCAPCTPIGLSMPSVQPLEIQNRAKEIVQTIFEKLDMQNGAFNFEYILDRDGNIWILELGPRNGGNLIPDTIFYASGIDLTEYTIKAALGERTDMHYCPTKKKHAASYIWHSVRDGIFQAIEISENLKRKIVQSEIFVNPGDKIYRYKNASHGIGAAILEFDSEDEMLYMMDHMNEFYNVHLT